MCREVLEHIVAVLKRLRVTGDPDDMSVVFRKSEHVCGSENFRAFRFARVTPPAALSGAPQKVERHIVRSPVSGVSGKANQSRNSRRIVERQWLADLTDPSEAGAYMRLRLIQFCFAQQALHRCRPSKVRRESGGAQQAFTSRRSRAA